MKISISKSYKFFLSIYLLALPLNALRIEGVGSLAKILSILPIIFALISIRNFKGTKELFNYFCYVGFAGLSIFWSVNTDDSISRFTSFALLFVLMASSCCFSYSQTDLDNIKSALCWSSRISAIVVLLVGTYREGRLWMTGVLFEDPNYFCMYLSFGVVFSLEKIMSGQSKNARLFAIIEFCVYITIALLTGSRGGLLALLIGTVIYVFFSTNKVFSLKKLFMLIIILCSLYIGFSFLSDDIQGRFSIEAVAATGGSNRIAIWKQGIDLFQNSSVFRQLFGYGTGTVVFDFGYFGYFHRIVMHNMFLESLIEIGIIGLIVYCVMVYRFVKRSVEIKNHFAFSIIVMMIFMSLSTSIYTFKPYIHIMIYVICASKYYKAQKEEKNVAVNHYTNV